MSQAFRSSMAALVIALFAGAAGAETYWVAAAARTPGVGGTLWYTDLSVLNLCSEEATVELRLHTESGVVAKTYVIPGGAQQIFEDVVDELMGGNGSGALELLSDIEVSVSSRIYNSSPAGTYGQSLDGVTAADGLAAGESAFLQQLRENAAFRTNVGALNMGAESATVTIDFHDRLGDLVGTLQVELPAGQTLQLNRPYREEFGRDDIVGGYVKVTVDSGDGVYPYGSVVDNETGDPTTVNPKPPTECPVDLKDWLEAIEGMLVIERPTAHEGYRYFVLLYDQPADHDNPDAGTFRQSINFLHRGYGAPMVLETLGYDNAWGDHRGELTEMLNANQLVVEHRFFSSSTPRPRDWSLLDIRQAAADHHRIVEVFKPMYSGAWINTGASKGGMTASYHRRFYPEDVDATVPYVAPISYGNPDERYLEFFDTVGEADCRAGLAAIQEETLERRDAMLAMMASEPYSYDRIGGLERAFESVVIEVPFTFWQYNGETYCSQIPDTDASDQAIYDFVDQFAGWWYAADFVFDYFDPYFYQAHTELGYPDIPTAHIDHLILTDPPTIEEGMPPEGVSTTFDPTVMPDVAQWLATEGERFLFVYGENDPWTAAAYELGDAVDSHIFVDPGGTHGAQIATLTPGDQAAVMAILERWTGVTPLPPAAAKVEPGRYPPWARVPPGIEGGRPSP